MPFKPCDERSTLEGYSRMFARLLCSILRTIRQDHPWCQEYPFDEEQLMAAEELLKTVSLEKDEINDDDVMKAIHALGISLFCKEHTHIEKGDFVCPVYRFLVMASIMEGGNFMGETDIAAIIAKLQWTCRAMIYEEMMTRMKTMSEKQAWRQLGRFIKEGDYTAFNSIRQIMHLASAIAYGTSGMPQIEWLDDDYQRACINGKAVELDDIRKFVLDRTKAAKMQLEKEILFGHEFKEFGYTSAKVMDVLRNRKIGYSFIDSPENGFIKFKDKLMETLLNDPRISPFFVKRVRGGRIEWNKDGCEKWLKRTKAFLETLMPTIHITYGQPSRGEELATIRVKNQLNGMRGVYMSRGLVMILVSYSKTRSTTGKDKLVARFLPKEVGDLLVKYLSLVRPMEAFIAEQIESEGFDKYEKMLFADHEKSWNGGRLGDIFKRQMNDWGPVAMGLAEYRQLAKAFMRENMKHRFEDDDEEDARDHQSGHTSRMAGMRYGIAASDLDCLTSDKLLAFFRASREWHRLLGFKGDEMEIKPGMQKVEKVRVPQTNDNSPDIADLIKNGIEAGMQAVLERMGCMVTERWKPAGPMPPPDPPVRVSVTGKSMKALQDFWNDKKARFKSVEQGKAFQLIVDGKTDVLAILPTGGGKSLLFFLPTMLEPGMTTVVIVPLIAVMKDLRDRCVEANITCATWDPDNRLTVATNLLFVAVEHAIESAFCDHLQVLHSTGLLKRIVMDEVHVRLTHVNFRLGMERLVNVLRCVSIQIVLLTATLPPFMQIQLRIAFACEVWEVIRAQTTRPEIGYEVIEVEDDEDGELDIEIAFRVKEELRKCGDKDRGIVYCLQKKWAEKLKDFLNAELGDEVCDIYHANLSKEVREAVYEEWKKGERIKILVATSALGLGIDYAHVRFVIHQGQSRSLVDFEQETGRAGRDGKEAHSIVFTSAKIRADCEWIEKKEKEWAGHNTGGWKVMKDWVADKDECRRLVKGEYMDGKGVNCLSLKECVWCDVCKAAMGTVEEKEERRESTRMKGIECNMKRARVERRSKVDLVLEIREMMDKLSRQCVLCWVRCISAKHKLEYCEIMPGKCLRCQDRDHVWEVCDKVHYIGGGCCYGCGLPHKLNGEQIHGDVMTGACETGFEDKMIPLCWYIWRDVKWGRRLEAHFRMKWNVDQFRKWIGIIGDDKITNGVRVMLWAWKEVEKKPR